MVDASVPLTPSRAPARLNAPWNAIGRVVWWLFAVASIGVLMASIPAFISQMGVMTPYELDNLRNVLPSGMSEDIFAPYESGVDLLVTVFTLVVSVVSIGLGIMIYWRRPGEVITLLTSCFLL